MTSSLMVLVALALQSAAPTPVAVVDIQTLGFIEKTNPIKKQVIDEIKAAGFAPKNRMEQKEACLTTPDCLSASPEDLLMAVTITKVAGSFQVAIKMASKDGAFSYDQTHYSESSDRFLDDKWTEAWTAQSQITSQGPLDDVAVATPLPKKSRGVGRPWWGYSGLGIAALGATLALTGGTLSALDTLTLRDSDSSGEDKKLAQKRGPAALAVTGAGVLVLGAGLLLFFVSAPDGE